MSNKTKKIKIDEVQKNKILDLLKSGKYQIIPTETEKTVKKQPKYRKVPRNPIDYEKFIYLITLIKHNETDETKKFNMVLLITLLYLSGARVGEIINLKKDNIKDFILNNQYNLYETKTKKNKKNIFNFINERYII